MVKSSNENIEKITEKLERGSDDKTDALFAKIRNELCESPINVRKKSKSRKSRGDLNYTEYSKENANYDLNILRNKESERKSLLFKRSSHHGSIGNLIKKSIRKVKERQQVDSVSRMEKMMKQKLLKQNQEQRNKVIRESNAKNWSLTQVARNSALNKYSQLEPKKSQRKESGVGQSRPITESERISMLGLKFIELSGKLQRNKKSENNIKKPKSNQTRAQMNKKREVIRKYIEEKNEKIKLEKKYKKSIEKEKKAKINKNIINLNKAIKIISKGEKHKKKKINNSERNKVHKNIIEEEKKAVDKLKQELLIVHNEVHSISSEEEPSNFEKLLKVMQSQNEKVTHLSRINTIDEDKLEKTLAVQTEEIVKNKEVIKKVPEVKTIETQTEFAQVVDAKKEEELSKNSSLPEIRLLIGSEQVIKNTSAIKESVQDSCEKNANCLFDSATKSLLFDRNPFQEFTLRKIKEMEQTDHLSKLVSMREQIMKYKEMTEKKYIHKMFKSKEFSPRTYQRKRRDLEKWVSKEKEEIKQSKKNITETWQRTMQIIEDAQKISINFKRTFAKHALMCNSASNSIASILDSSRSNEENGRSTFNIERYWKREKSLDDINYVLNTQMPIDNFRYLTDTGNNQAILIQDNNLSEGKPEPISPKHLNFEDADEGEKKAIKDVFISEEDINNDKIEFVRTEDMAEDSNGNDIKEPLPNTPEISSLLIDIKRKDNEEIVTVKSEANINKRKAEETVDAIYADIINEVLASLYPAREFIHSSVDLDKETKGIQRDPEYINKFLDKVFEHMIKKYKGNFVKEVNNAVSKSFKEVLENIQSNKNMRISMQLPHDVQPIIPINVYLDIEKEKSNKKVLAGYEQIHDKAIFDSVNEALNLIRPYGLNGEPFPWSTQQRILFKSINDLNIITRNIKNMILDWTSLEVGILPRNEFIANGKFNEEYFADAREKRLLDMLTQEVMFLIT